ncbi:MAG: MBL fold metallo-hydrolase [Hymenobacteraceae bacterium]|nr:MBL fold metallo-hydrolase [Hymenobacteraceae bacterium]
MKIKAILALALSLSFLQVSAQRTAPDQEETTQGPLTVQPILHGSVVLNWNNKTIYVDPYGGAEAYAGIARPDLILITDIHGDHLDKKTLEALETENAVLVVPQAVADQLPEKYKQQTVVITNGDSTTQAGIQIKAMPMYNLPESADARHTKGRGNGYILSMGGKNVYLAGDTEDIPEMRALKGIDIAFIPMNLPYTMDVNQAASAVLEFKPKVVYPYHYRGQEGLSDVELFRKIVNAKDNNIEVRLKNWYPEKKQ